MNENLNIKSFDSDIIYFLYPKLSKDKQEELLLLLFNSLKDTLETQKIMYKTILKELA